jgi:hypothetical protein
LSTGSQRESPNGYEMKRYKTFDLIRELKKKR